MPGPKGIGDPPISPPAGVSSRVRLSISYAGVDDDY